MSKTYKLKYPFLHNGEQFVAVEIRRPKMRDLKALAKFNDPTEKSIAMLGQLADLSPAVVEEMDAEDFAEASKIIAVFMGVSEAEMRRLSSR